MADNIVEVVIKGRDDTGAAFAGATAEEKAFARAVDQSNTQQVKGYQAASAAASSHLRAVKLLDEVAKHEAEDAAKAAESHLRLGNVMSRVGDGLKSMNFGFANLIQNFGNMGTAFINPITIGLGALAAIMSGPLLASLLPITLGFVAFGGVAFGEITKISTAFNALNSAQAQLAAAKTPTQRQAALHAEAVAMAGLNSQEKALVPLTQELGRQVSGLMKAVQPYVIKAFGEGLKIIKDLMPAIKPLAEAAGKAIDGFLGKIDSWLKSGSGQKFLKWLAVDGPKDIATFGRVMWDTARFIGSAFRFLMDAGHTWYQNMSRLMHDAAVAVDRWRENFIGAGHTIESIWNDIKGAFEAGYNFIAGIVSQIIAAIAPLTNAVSAVSNAFGTISGLGSSIGSALGGFFGLASGGITAASGGPRSGMTLVGEHGPELLSIPGGSRVYSNNQTRGMLGGGGGNSYQISVQVAPGGHPAETGRQIVNLIREFERSSGKGWRAA